MGTAVRLTRPSLSLNWDDSNPTHYVPPLPNHESPKQFDESGAFKDCPRYLSTATPTRHITSTTHTDPQHSTAIDETKQFPQMQTPPGQRRRQFPHDSPIRRGQKTNGLEHQKATTSENRTRFLVSISKKGGSPWLRLLRSDDDPASFVGARKTAIGEIGERFVAKGKIEKEEEPSRWPLNGIGDDAENAFGRFRIRIPERANGAH